MRCHRSMLQVIRHFACVSIVATVAAATTANVAKAAELNRAHVPVDAKWLLHIDQEAFLDVEAIEELRQMYPQITSNIRKWFKDRYGIDPQEDLRSLTMFSRDYQLHTGTVLLETEYDAKKMKSILHKYDSMTKTEWKGHTLYTITLAKHHGHHDNEKHAAHHSLKLGAESQGKNSRSAAVEKSDGHDESGGKQMTVYLGDELIVLASSVPNAKSVLRLLEGDAASLEGTNSPLVAEAPAGAVIYGAAIELGRLDQYEMLLPLLQQQEKCVYAFGQRDGKLFETLTLTGQSEEVAEKTKEVLEGVIAYEQLWAAGSAPLTELINNVRLSRDGTELMLTWEGESELVTKAFGDLKKRVDQWVKMAINLKAKEEANPLHSNERT